MLYSMEGEKCDCYGRCLVYGVGIFVGFFNIFWISCVWYIK